MIHRTTPALQDTETSHLGNMELILAHPALKAFMCGSLSGTCSTLLFQPLDLVKTRLQTLQGNMLPGSPRVGMVAVFLNVVRTENLLGLWKGVSPSVPPMPAKPCCWVLDPGPWPVSACCPSLSSRRASSYTDPDPAQVNLTDCAGIDSRSGAGTGCVMSQSCHLMFQSGRYNYVSVFRALRSVCEAEGARALFSGLTATLLRDAPFSGIYVMFYSQTKKSLPQEVSSSPYAPLVNFSCGVLAGIMASLVTQPADVVKTHLQVSPHLYKRTRDAVRFIYTEQGLSGFFRGAVPRCLRRTLMAAMAWTVYEQLMARMGLKS